MKKKYFLIPAIYLLLMIIGLNLYSSQGSRKTESTTKTINYNIQAYNKTGSFIVQWGNKNSPGGKFEGYVRVVNEDGKIIQEITSAKLEKAIQNLNVIKTHLNADKVRDAQLKRMTVSLREFQKILEDKTRFNEFAAKFNSLQTQGGMPYSYTISTIRGQQETVSGTIY